MAGHEVEIAPLRMTPSGARYTVTYQGDVLICAARDPEYEACRALRAQGHTGTLATRWAGSATIAMVIDIETGARLTTSDGNVRLHVASWKPHPTEAELTE